MSNSALVNYIKRSPNCTKPRNHKIDTITIHCTAFQATASEIANITKFTKHNVISGASCNYAIGKDGSIALIVDEENRSWCSSNKANDHRAITIEVSSDSKPPYDITNAALSALIELCADICKRNGITSMRWKNDPKLIGQTDKQNVTVHRWFANKECPGARIMSLLPFICNECNIKLGGNSNVVPPLPSLKKGNKGEKVLDLQICLNRFGFNLDEDGSFGPATDAAVRSFQYNNGLVIDGSYGPKTYAKMKELLCR